MLQTTAISKMKVLSQYITIYQSIIEFKLEELGINFIIKFNKEDPDSIIDDVNAKLIETCGEYLKENNMGLDKFQLATIVMKLFCESVSSLPQPFYVQARESKNLMKDYVKANKEYMEKVKKVKRENEELLKEASKLEKQRQEAKRQINTPIEEPIVEEKVIQKRPLNIHTTPKKNDKFKYRNHDTNTLVDTFTF